MTSSNLRLIFLVYIKIKPVEKFPNKPVKTIPAPAIIANAQTILIPFPKNETPSVNA